MTYAPWLIGRSPYFFLPPSQTLVRALVEKDPETAICDFHVIHKKSPLSPEEQQQSQFVLEVLNLSSICQEQRKDLPNMISPEKQQRFNGFFNLAKYGLHSCLEGGELALQDYYSYLLILFKKLNLCPEIYLSGHELSSIVRGNKVLNPQSPPIFYCLLTFSTQVGQLNSQAIASLNEQAKQFFSNFSDSFFQLLNETFIHQYQSQGKPLSQEKLSKSFEQKYRRYFDNEGGICVYKIGGVQLKVLLLPSLTFFYQASSSHAFFDFQHLIPALEADKFAFHLQGFNQDKNAQWALCYQPVSLVAHSPHSRKILDEGLIVDRSFSPFTFQDLLIQYSNGGVLTSEEDYAKHLEAYLSSGNLQMCSQEMQKLDIKQDSLWITYLNFIHSLYKSPQKAIFADQFLQSKPYFPVDKNFATAEEKKIYHQLVYLLCFLHSQKIGDQLYFKDYQLRPSFELSLEDTLHLLGKYQSLFLQLQKDFFNRFFPKEPCSSDIFFEKLCSHFSPLAPKDIRLSNLYKGLFNAHYKLFQDFYFEKDLSLNILKVLLRSTRENKSSFHTALDSSQALKDPKKWREYLAQLSDSDIEIFDLLPLKMWLQNPCSQEGFSQLVSQHILAFYSMLPPIHSSKIFVYQKAYAPHLAFLMSLEPVEFLQNSLSQLWWLPQKAEELYRWARHVYCWSQGFQEFLNHLPSTFQNLAFLRFYLLIHSPDLEMAQEFLKAIKASDYEAFQQEEKQAFHISFFQWMSQQEKDVTFEPFLLSALSFMDLSTFDLSLFQSFFDFCRVKEQKQGINRLYKALLERAREEETCQKALEKMLQQYPCSQTSAALQQSTPTSSFLKLSKGSDEKKGEAVEKPLLEDTSNLSWSKEEKGPSLSSTLPLEQEKVKMPFNEKALKEELHKTKDKTQAVSCMKQLLVLNRLEPKDFSKQQSLLLMQELSAGKTTNKDLELFAAFLPLIKEKNPLPKCKSLIADYFSKNLKSLLENVTLDEVLLMHESIKNLLSQPLPLADLEGPIFRKIEALLKEANHSEVDRLTPLWIENIISPKKGEGPLFLRYEANILELFPLLARSPLRCKKLSTYFLNLYVHAVTSHKSYPRLLDHFPLIQEGACTRGEEHLIQFKNPDAHLSLLEHFTPQQQYLPYLFSHEFSGSVQSCRHIKICIRYLSLRGLCPEMQEKILEKVLEHQNYLNEKGFSALFETFKYLESISPFQKLLFMQRAYTGYFLTLKGRSPQVAINTLPDYKAVLSSTQPLSCEQAQEICNFFSQVFSKISLELRYELSPFLCSSLQMLWTNEHLHPVVADFYKTLVSTTATVGMDIPCLDFFLSHPHSILPKKDQFKALMALKDSLLFENDYLKTLLKYFSLVSCFTSSDLNKEESKTMLACIYKVLHDLKPLKESKIYTDLLASHQMRSFYQMSLDIMHAHPEEYSYQDFPELLSDIHQMHPELELLHEEVIACHTLPNDLDKYLRLVKNLKSFHLSWQSMQARLILRSQKHPESFIKSCMPHCNDLLQGISEETRLAFFQPLFSPMYQYLLSAPDSHKNKVLAQDFLKLVNEAIENDPIFVLNLLSLNPSSSLRESLEIFSSLLTLAKLSNKTPCELFKLLKAYFTLSQSLQEEEQRVVFCLEFYQTFKGDCPLVIQQDCFDTLHSYLLGKVPFSWKENPFRLVRGEEGEKEAQAWLLELYTACFQLAASLDKERKIKLFPLLQQGMLGIKHTENPIPQDLLQASFSEKKKLPHLNLRCQKFLLEDCDPSFPHYHQTLLIPLVELFRLYDGLGDESKQDLFSTSQVQEVKDCIQKVFESLLKAPDELAYSPLHYLLHYTCQDTQSNSSQQIATQLFPFLIKMLKNINGGAGDQKSLEKLCQVACFFHFAIEGEDIQGGTFNEGRGLIKFTTLERMQKPLINDFSSFASASPKLFKDFLMDLFKSIRSYLHFQAISPEQKQHLLFYNHCLFLSKIFTQVLGEGVIGRVFSNCDLMILMHHLSMLPQLSEADFSLAFVIRNQFYLPAIEDIIFQIDHPKIEKERGKNKKKSPQRLSQEQKLCEEASKPYQQLVLEFAFSTLASKMPENSLYVGQLASLHDQGFFRASHYQVEPMLQFVNHHYLEITKNHCQRFCTPTNRAFLFAFPSLQLALEKCVKSTESVEAPEYKSTGKLPPPSKEPPQLQALNDFDTMLQIMIDSGVLDLPTENTYYSHQESLYHKYLKPRFHLMSYHLATLNYPEKGNFTPSYLNLHSRFENYAQMIKRTDVFNALQPLLYYNCGLAKKWGLEPLTPHQSSSEEDLLFTLYQRLAQQVAQTLDCPTLEKLPAQKLKTICLYLNAALNSPIYQYYEVHLNFNFYSKSMRDFYSYQQVEYAYLFWLGFILRTFVQKQEACQVEISNILQVELIEKFFNGFDCLQKRAQSSKAPFPQSWYLETRLIQCKAMCQFLNLCFSYPIDQTPLFTKSFVMKAAQILRGFLQDAPHMQLPAQISLPLLLQMCEEYQKRFVNPPERS